MNSNNLIESVFGFNNEFFNESGRPNFMNKNYFLKLNYTFIQDRERGNKKKLRCMFPECNKKAIMSHSIPKGVVLKVLSDDNNNLFYPKYDVKRKEYKIDKVHIKQASIFPGFCTEHEDLFSGFEKNGNFRHESMALQNLRVIYRYYSRWNNLKRAFEKHKKKYTEELSSYQLDKINILNKYQISNIKLLNVEDDIINHCDKNLDFINYMITEIHNKDLLPFLKTSNGDEDSMKVILIEIDIALPLSMAGRSELKVNNKFLVYLSLFASKNKTTLCFSYLKEFENDFQLLISHYKTDIDIVSFIESWMIYGTDDWFINPIEWNSYAKDKQKKILTLLKETEKFPNEKLDFDIFINARKKYDSTYK